jgi:hypothetical protein
VRTAGTNLAKKICIDAEKRLTSSDPFWRRKHNVGRRVLVLEGARSPALQSLAVIKILVIRKEPL